jgi:uncharacterized protein
MAGNRLQIEAYADERILEALSRHRCVGCGECCRWPGQVILYADDIKRIARELDLAEEDFLTRYCVVVWWKRADCDQFRIALARKDGGRECIFLKGALCTIHQFKPLKCKAGPSGRSWIASPKYFWYYVRGSPSFRHQKEMLPRAEADRWFTATLDAEVVASSATSLAALAANTQLSEDVLRRLELIEFKEVLQMSADPGPEPPVEKPLDGLQEKVTNTIARSQSDAASATGKASGYREELCEPNVAAKNYPHEAAE